MSLAPYGKAIVNMHPAFEQTDECSPYVFAFSGFLVRCHITDQYDGISCAREENVETLRRGEKSDVVTFVTSGERHNDDLTLFALIIV